MIGVQLMGVLWWILTVESEMVCRRRRRWHKGQGVRAVEGCISNPSSSFIEVITAANSRAFQMEVVMEEHRKSPVRREVASALGKHLYD